MYLLTKILKTYRYWYYHACVPLKFIGKRVRRYQRGNQNLYIKEEQTTQRPKENGQKDKTVLWGQSSSMSNQRLIN
jgi:hypothetical protein